MKHEIWSFMEKENDKLHDIACKMAAEAKRTAGIFDAVPCGIMMGTSSPEDLNQYGLEKIYTCDCRQSVHSPEMVAGVIHDMAVKRNPQFILFAQTPLGSEVAGRLSASLKRGLIADCIDFERLDNQPCAKKQVYEGKAHALVTWLTPPPYLSTIDPASLEEVKQKKIVEPEVIYNKLNVKDPNDVKYLVLKLKQLERKNLLISKNDETINYWKTSEKGSLMPSGITLASNKIVSPD